MWARSVVDRGRDVLHQRAACGDVQDLRAAADREHRQVRFDRAARQVDLELVAAGSASSIDSVALLAVEHRIDVAAAGQQHAVDLADQPSRALADLEHARTSASLFDRREVVVQAAAAGDADDRFHVVHGFLAARYIFAGTPHPIRSSACVSCCR